VKHALLLAPETCDTVRSQHGDGGIKMRRAWLWPAHGSRPVWWRNRVAALMLGGLLIAGCSDGSTQSGEDPVPAHTSATVSEPAAPVGPPLVRLSLTAECVTTGDLEGAFSSSSQMGDYLECILHLLPEWTKRAYKQMPMPEGFQFVPAGHSSRVGTKEAGCSITDGALLYCTLDRQVYFGELSVWELYSKNGDAAPVTVAAHELTHHFQLMVEMPASQTYNEQIKYENQSDCGAGAFMKFADGMGYVDRDDDIKDLADALNAAGEEEGPDQSHGTSVERLTAFDRAYLSSSTNPLIECNFYTPGHKLINA